MISTDDGTMILMISTDNKTFVFILLFIGFKLEVETDVGINISSVPICIFNFFRASRFEGSDLEHF